MDKCEHLNFRADARIGRIQRDDSDPTIVGFSADLTIHCVDCGHRFEFIGLPMGYSPYRPMCSIDGFEARLPIKPEGVAMPMGLPELAVRMVENG
jgi:hypothetical protein